MQLSDGAIVDILNGGNPEKPVLQVLNVKKITAPNASDRYRLLLSDGDHTYSHAMLAAQMNKLLENDEMKNMAVIEVTKYMCNTLGEKRVLILLDLNVLTNDVGEKIGDPVQLSPTNIPQRSEVSKPNSNGGSMAQKPSQASKPTQNNNTFNNSGTPGTPSKAVHSIASLTPYQNRWRIRARVTVKSGIRTWSNSRGEGKLFNVNLLDDSGEIRLTGFNDQVDKYHDMLEINKVFYVSKCTLKTANKQYSNLKNDYEMTMTPETLIEVCNDNVSTPELKFEFVKINELEKATPNSAVDVIGIVKTVNDISTVIGKASQKEISKRDIQIVDQSGVQINMTIWGNEAISFDGQGFPVMAVRGCKVSDYGGRSLSALGGTSMMINPDLKEAHILRGWWDSEGRDMNYSTFQGEGGSQGGGSNSNWKMFSQVKSENLGSGEKPDYYTTKGTVMFLKKDNCMYQACPTDECNKKLIDQGNGQYRCEKCNKEFPNYKWRMILNANIADHSDNTWATCFQESAEGLLQIKANDLGAMREKDEQAFEGVFRDALFKHYIFKMRAKMETYNDEHRLKTVCVSAVPVNWVDYGKRLVEQLDQLGV